MSEKFHSAKNNYNIKKIINKKLYHTTKKLNSLFN